MSCRCPSIRSCFSRTTRGFGFAETPHHHRRRGLGTMIVLASSCNEQGGRLEDLVWKNVFVESLPEDPSRENRTRQVEGAIFTRVTPTSTGTEPTLVIGSSSMASTIGLSPSEFNRPEFPLIFSGNAICPGSDPYAQCYGGHQFGQWAGQLGDGRAISLGEVQEPGSSLKTSARWELQLKGAGRTPYSRMADGRAVLRSSVREYVASEAMAALGVPTTRALSLVMTGDEVMRDMFYNGNAQMEPGAVVCRVARSFVRFGSFQLPASRGDFDLVRTLADFVMREYYPECNGYDAFFETVSRKTGEMIAEWQRVGFTHGVCNSDNYSILGDTIDYGPYGWMERFDPNFTPNTTDLPGRRYCFQSQPSIGQWNLLQLARALVAAGLLDEDAAEKGMAVYAESVVTRYNNNMARKLGMKTFDKDITNRLLMLMYESQGDYTNTFRALGTVDLNLAIDLNEVPTKLRKCFGDLFDDEKEMAWISWLKDYSAALKAQGVGPAERYDVQSRANPAIVPRNHVMVGIISDVEQGDFDSLREYMDALMDPYSEDSLKDSWLEPAPSQPRLGVELLSCSS